MYKIRLSQPRVHLEPVHPSRLIVTMARIIIHPWANYRHQVKLIRPQTPPETITQPIPLHLWVALPFPRPVTFTILLEAINLTLSITSMALVVSITSETSLAITTTSVPSLGERLIVEDQVY